jgi:hypothetical protein
MAQAGQKYSPPRSQPNELRFFPEISGKNNQKKQPVPMIPLTYQ